MGCHVGRGQERLVSAPTPRGASGSCDVVINSALFVKENKRPFEQQYELGRLLGSGSYADVHECFHKASNQFRAVKIFKKNLHKLEFGSTAELSREVDIMLGLDHPSLAKVFEYFNEERQLLIVMELCSGGELFNLLCSKGKVNENRAAVLMQQLLSAVSYMHSQGVVHRDLKPENILLQTKDIESAAKVVDFGVATYISSAAKPQRNGTPLYMAPEMFGGRCTELCDEWSLGVILYLMLTGYPPFEGNRISEIVKKITSLKYNTDKGVWKRLSPDAADLVHRLLSPEDTRISAVDALRHPWVVYFSNPETPATPAFEDALSHIKSFHKTTKLVDAAMTFLTTQRLTIKDVKHIRDALKGMDTDGDGKLSFEDLVKGMNSSVSRMSEQEVTKLVQKLDRNQSGLVDYTEFLKVTVSSQTLLSKTNLVEAFRLFDSDNRGKISADEIRRALAVNDVDEAVISELVREVNVDSDGQIDLPEFERLFLHS